MLIKKYIINIIEYTLTYDKVKYCDFLKEEPGSENNRTDRKFIYAALFIGLKKIILREFFTPAIICCQCQSNS